MQYSKNLIPDTSIFYNSIQNLYTMNTGEYFLNSFTPSSSDYVTRKGTYEFELVASGNNRDVRVLIPVKPNTYYKPSADTNGDVHIFYYDAGRTAIGQTYDTVSKNLTALTPSNCAYILFALTNRGLGAGKYYFKNWQLEEVRVDGMPASPFTPYDLGMKQTKRIEKVNDDMSGAGSHAYPYGNIISVKEDVFVWNSQIKVYTAGTFNVAIYEWDNGRIGDPLFDKKMDAAVGTFDYNFGGVKLFAGKKYWIGRLSTDPNDTGNTGNAAVGRSTGMPASACKYVDTLGGTSFRASTIDFTSTWYYFYGLTFEAIGLRDASLVPEKNLIPLDPNIWTPGTINGNDGAASYSNSRVILKKANYIPVKPFHTYSISLRESVPSDVNIREMYWYREDGTYISAVSGAGTTFTRNATFTSPAGAAYFVPQLLPDKDARRLDISEFYDKIQFEESSAPTEYKKYNLAMKPDTEVPKDNLLNPNLSNWTQGSVDSAGNITGGSNRLVFKERIKVSSNSKYTLKVNNGYRLFMRVFSDQTAEITNTGWVTDGYIYTTPANARTVMFLVSRVDDTNLTVSEVLNAMPMLAQGEFTEFKPYELAMKPAILYPKKNLLNPDAWQMGRYHDGAFQPTSFRVEPNRVVIVSGFNSMVNQIINVEPNTDYTVYHDSPGDGKRGIYIYSLTGTDLKPVTHVSPVTFNTGSNTKISVSFYKSASANELSEIDFNYPMMEKGTQTSYEPFDLVNKPL